MNESNNKREAELTLAWKMWHRDPMTRRFFATLEKRAKFYAFRAAARAGRTGERNAGEHNNLVRVNEIIKIIESYGRAESNLPEDIAAD